MLTYGIDVSAWQAGDAPGHVPGIHFAMSKATQGTTYVSPVHGEQITAARAAGLTTGSYHFLESGHIQAQADHFLKHAQLVAGDIIGVDWEDPNNGGAPATASEKDLFLAIVKRARPTHRVVLYCNRDYWTNRDSSGKCGDGLWIADPSSPAGQPGIKHGWVFHQYGQSAGIDRNVYHGTAAQLRIWAWGASAPGTPPPPVHTYTVRPGDTLSGIADSHHVTLARLEKANPQIHNFDRILPGQLVRLP